MGIFIWSVTMMTVSGEIRLAGAWKENDADSFDKTAENNAKINIKIALDS